MNYRASQQAGRGNGDGRRVRVRQNLHRIDRGTAVLIVQTGQKIPAGRVNQRRIGVRAAQNLAAVRRPIQRNGAVLAARRAIQIERCDAAIERLARPGIDGRRRFIFKNRGRSGGRAAVQRVQNGQKIKARLRDKRRIVGRKRAFLES